MGKACSYDTQRRRPAFRLEDCPEDGDAEKTADDILRMQGAGQPGQARDRSFGPAPRHQAMYALLRERDQLLADLDKPSAQWWSEGKWAAESAASESPFARRPSFVQAISDTWTAFRYAGVGQFSEAKKTRLHRLGDIERELDRTFPDHNQYLLQQDVKHLRQGIANRTQEKARLQRDTTGAAADLIADIDIELAALDAELQKAKTAVVANDMAMVHAGIRKNADSYDISTRSGKLRFAAEMTMVSADLGGAALPRYWETHHHAWRSPETPVKTSPAAAPAALDLPTVEQLHRLWSAQRPTAGEPASLEQKVALVVDSVDPDKLRALSPDAPDLETVRAVLREQIVRQLRATADGQASNDATPLLPAHVGTTVMTAVGASTALYVTAATTTLSALLAPLIATAVVGMGLAWYNDWWPFSDKESESLHLDGVTEDATSDTVGTGDFIDLAGVTQGESSDDITPAGVTSTPSSVPAASTGSIADEEMMLADQAIPADPQPETIKATLAAFRTEFGNRLAHYKASAVTILAALEGFVSPANEGKTITDVIATFSDEGAPNTEQALSEFLSLMGLTLPAADEYLIMVNVAPFNRSIEIVNDMIKELDLLALRLPSASASELSGVQTVTSQIGAFPRLVLPRGRDLWKALTNGRALWALWDLRWSREYANFISGMGPRLTVTQQNIEKFLGLNDFIAQTWEDFTRVFGRLDYNDVSRREVSAFRQWVADLVDTYDRLAEGGNLHAGLLEYKALLENGNEVKPENREKFKAVVALLAARGLTDALLEKIAALPAVVQEGSKLEKMKKRAETRMSTMQSMRALTSIPSLTGVGTRIVGYIYAGNQVEATIALAGAFEEFCASIKVPWDLAMAAKDAAKGSGEKFSTELSKKTKAPFKTQYQDDIARLRSVIGCNKKIAVDGVELELLEFDGKRGYKVPLATLPDLDKSVTRQISKLNKTPTTHRRVDEFLKELRNQAPFLAQDVLSLFINAYTFATKGEMSEAERAELALKIAASTSFLSGTSINTFFKGPGQVMATRGLNALGVAANIGAGIANIVKISQRSDDNKGRDMGLAIAQLITETALLIGAVAFPVVGTLVSLAVPNFTSIGAAIDYHQIAKDLDSNGKHTEAATARKLRDMAIWDSIPVANWLAFVYQPAYMQSITVSDTAIHSGVAESIISQLRIMHQQIAPNLPQRVGETAIYPVLICPVTFTTSYFRNNPGVLSPNHGIRINETQTITLWAGFSNNTDRFWVFPDEIRHTVYWDGRLRIRGESYPELKLQPAIVARSYESRNLALPGQARNPTIPEFSIVDGKSDTVDTSGMTLYVRNTRIARPTIYQIKDEGTGKVRIQSSDQSSTFVIKKPPAHINGGKGRNEVVYDPSTTESTIDLSAFNNIGIVRGAAATRSVVGTVDNMVYVPAAGNGQETIRINGQGNTVISQNGTDIDLGEGDSRVIAQGMPGRAMGGPGTDLLSFGLSSMTGIRLQNDVVSSTASSQRRARIGGIEIVELSAGNDVVHYTTDNTDIRTFVLGGGNDTITMSGISNTQVLLGTGHDQARIHAGRPYSNFTILGEDGNKDIEMVVKGTGTFIQTGDGDNRVVLKLGSSQPENAVLMLGGRNNSVKLGGNIGLEYHISRYRGGGTIDDHVSRTAPLLIVCTDVTKDQIKAELFVPATVDGQQVLILSIQKEDGSGFDEILNVKTWTQAQILVRTTGDGLTSVLR